MADLTLSTDSPSLNQSVPPPLPITRGQCRAARALLFWSQGTLARRTGISAVTIRTFERGRNSIKPSTARLLRLTFEAAGVGFLDAGDGCGAGVCLAKPER